jgi:predicted HicB family RNase H-like nuclease
MGRADHYTYRVRWSAEDESYLGTVAELPSLSWSAEDRSQAFEGIQRLAAEVVEDMLASGEQPPEAIADRSYSGKFMVRVPPEVHRQLNIEAAEQQVSLNRLVSARLSMSACAGPSSAV